MDTRRIPLEAGCFYHIYNRGINGQNIFFEEKNYYFFLERYAKYVFPFVETYAYCMLKNHFHLLIQVRTEEEIRLYLKGKKSDKSISWHVSNAFASLFQSYAQAVNKTYHRTGSLFEEPFHRIEVGNDAYFSYLIWYIHHNPQKHGFIKDFRDYVHSSFWSHLHHKPTKLNRDNVLQWFGNRDGYTRFHAIHHHESVIRNLIIEF